MITVNDIKFTPRPDCKYKYDYVDLANFIKTPSRWPNRFPPEYLDKSLHPEVNEAWVAKTVWRQVILSDLWFVCYFVLGIPEAICNTPFVVEKAKMVEDGPKTDTLDVWARGHSKAIDVNEPVPTQGGWKKHGNLVPGDYVYGPDGLPAKVIAKTPVFIGAECFRVQFDTGYSVVVSGDHLWTVEISHKARINKSNTRTGHKTVTITTHELLQELNKSKSLKTRILPRIPVALPIHKRKNDLLINPYALGVWLGDGTTGDNCVTSGFEDFEEMNRNIQSCGYKTSIRKHSNAVTISISPGIRGKKGTSEFRNHARHLGVLNQKHIPEDYMNASKEDRFSLLQGLMDTDGTINKKHAQVSFTASNPMLAAQVHSLISSLGIKCSIKNHNSSCNGKIFPTWTLQFTPKNGQPPFRLRRKINKCVDRPVQQSRYRRITGIEPVTSIPVSCITVDRPDGLYLFGKEYITTHNSSLITKAETIQYHLRNPDHCSCIFSFNKPTAEAFVKSIKEAFELPFLISCFPDVLHENPKAESSSWSVQNGVTIKRKNNTRTEATVMASGLIEGMLTGKHFERRIYDDFETADLARTPEQLDLCYSQFEMSSYLGTKTDRDVVRMIGTIYSHMGPIVRLKDKKDVEGKPIYHTRVVPGTVGGEWDGKPVFWSQKILNFEKTLDHYAMQVLCDPTPTKLRSFKSECLIEIDPHNIPKNILKFMIVDPAGDNANGKKGDCWAIPVIGIDASELDELGGANIYITHALISPLGKDAAVEEIARMYLGSGVIQAIGVEKQPGAVNYLDSQIQEVLASRGRRVSIDDKSLVLLPTGGRNKKEKIQNALQWRFSNGKIHISKAVPVAYRERLKQEMDKFPYWHDDFLDSLAYFFDLIKDANVLKYNNSMMQYRFITESYMPKTAVA